MNEYFLTLVTIILIKMNSIVNELNYFDLNM